MAAVHSANISTTSDWVGPRRALPAIGLAGVCLAAGFTELSADEGQVFCPYRLATGGWCPGCGGTRALKSLVRGDVGGSLAMNPWTAVLFIQALTLSIGLLSKPHKTLNFLAKHQVRLAYFNLGVALAFWVVRLGFGTIPLPFG